ncbi:hypothetical protein CIHG_04694 [Coccidioides immitis H538.4]|uniref:Uncharacterized protein n=3 Tax=Coccidioides immitis TaxID=5501 RepID=A0A0J8QIM4_COCIT|nr:hypothetical protein CIRG_08115 [Coccidioides immitis RMSCC 2394]KMU72311.1 hypothetical protein CISG_02960 [Coccidioides immitis RMSCC 3703]KMU87249.1 hypothetical protein CIHG_04694 [Coccidioides immitis H538.4]
MQTDSLVQPPNVHFCSPALLEKSESATALERHVSKLSMDMQPEGQTACPHYAGAQMPKLNPQALALRSSAKIFQSGALAASIPYGGWRIALEFLKSEPHRRVRSRTKVLLVGGEKSLIDSKHSHKYPAQNPPENPPRN